MKRHQSASIWHQRQRAIERWVRFYRSQVSLGTPAERDDFIARNSGRFAKHSFACSCHRCRAFRCYDSFAFYRRSFYHSLDRYEDNKWEDAHA